MKYAALAWVIEYYLTIGIVWFFIIAAAYLLTKKAKPDVRTSTLILAVASVPLYFWLGLDIKYHQYKQEKYLRQHRAIADKSSQLYKKICAEKPAINVKKVVQNATAVDIRVVQTEYKTYGLDIFRPQPKTACHSACMKRACWLVNDFALCSRSNIGSIEWSQDDFRSTKPHFFRFGALGIQDTNGFSSQYGLYVSAPERIDPLIEKYKVFVSDVNTGEVLAETFLYQKYWHLEEKSEAEMKEPMQCPESDVQIADMLSQAFPVPPGRVKTK